MSMFMFYWIDLSLVFLHKLSNMDKLTLDKAKISGDVNLMNN